MFRRQLIVAAVAVMFAVSGRAADAAHSGAATLPLAETPLALHALFERAPGVVEEADGSRSVGPYAVDVILARVDGKGKLVKACVDNEADARKFLDAPVGRVQRKAAEH